MKVLYVDLICPSGHVFYNNVQIACLSKRYKVDFVFQKGYANCLNIPKGCEVTEYKSFHGRHNVLVNALHYRIYMLKFQKLIADIAKKKSYDVIFISSFETLSFCLSFPYKCKVIAICHNNIDYIKTSCIKRNLFLKASKRINFVALNKTTSDYFHEIGAHHIMASHGTLVKGEMCHIEKFVFMPVNDCLDTRTLQFLQSDAFLHFLETSEMKLYIKEKFCDKEYSSIMRLPNYVNREVFDTLMCKAMAVLLPYDSNRYKYRSSGLFYEAVGMNKAIIAPNLPNFEAEICEGDIGMHLYKDPAEIIGIIQNIIIQNNEISYGRLMEKMDADIVGMV